MRPFYVMLIGLPGSGKTTLARDIQAELPNMHWHVAFTDDYIERVAAEEDSTYNAVFQSAIRAATKDMNENLHQALHYLQNIVHDQTNLTAKSRDKKMASVPGGYIAVGIVCECDEVERRKRLLSRPGKAIPDHVDEQMTAQYEAPTIEEFDILATAGNWRDVLLPIIMEEM